MKKYFSVSYVLVISILFLVSCSENENLSIENEVVKPNKALKQTLSTDVGSISNPTLQNDWENVSLIYLNNGPTVQAPWKNSEGNSIDIPYEFRSDIKKSDGWKLLAHTILNQTSGEPNYILFYNAKRGILKVFYYQLTPIKNNSLVWAMESVNKPTSIFPSNEKVQGILNSKYQYATTSGVFRQSSFNFGALQPGWNAFSFELPYGTIDKNPIIHFRGHHNESAQIKMFGTFSGDITMNIPKASGFDAIMGKIKEIVGTVPIGGFQSSANQALATLGFIAGNTSMFESTTSMTTIKGTTSGNIQLTGSLFYNFSGSVQPLFDVDLRKINNNEDLGLWTLSSTPVFEYDKYEEVYPYTPGNLSGLAKFSGYMNLRPGENLTSLVIINPIVANTIESYRVIDYRFISSKPLSDYREMLKIKDDCYYYRNFSFNSETYVMDGEVNYTSFILVHRLNTKPDINITVEFTYKDGSKLVSTRNYSINPVSVENTWVIDNARESGKTIKYIYSSVR